MVNAETARGSASREIESGPQQDDPHFSAWKSAIPGDPQLVHDLLGRPEYWLVPVKNQETTVGAIRVLANGRVAASIAHRQGSDLLALTRTEILNKSRPAIATGAGEVAGEVLLVHDGPPGREAWRVEVILDGRVVRWIFVTPGGIYERAAGNLPADQKLPDQ